MNDSFSKNLKQKIEEAKAKLKAEQATVSTALPALRDSNNVLKPIDVSDAFEPSTISATIEAKIAIRDTNKLGLFAFFSRKGEEARTKLARAQAEHGQALASLESARQQARAVEFGAQHLEADLIRNKVIQVAQARASLLAAEQQIEFLIIQTHLAQEAASRGFDFATDQELRKKQTEIEHELQRIEKQTQIELHKFEEQERIKFEYEQKKLDAETDATIRLANTENLNRAQILALMHDYHQKTTSTTIPEMKKNYRREIKRLERLLADEPGGMARKAYVREDSEGDTSSSKPRNDSKSSTGKDKQRSSPSDSRPVD